MDINFVHLFFEQSGTFKKAFKMLGYDAYDYDIKNDFEETDFVCDLFNEIELCYNGKESIFDKIRNDDLIFAFFPCIYFCEINQTYFTGKTCNFNGKDKVKEIIIRSEKRQYYYAMLLKLCWICEIKNLKIIIENPYSVNHYLYNNFPYKPAYIDYNRNLRGDYYKKPTQYYFINCNPTTYNTFAPNKILKTIRKVIGNKHGGVCNTERSMISLEYAINFICDKILGKKTEKTELTLF